MVEDFENATSTTPLSSIPHQVLVYATNTPAVTCSAKPTINAFFGGRRNLACFGNLNLCRKFYFINFIYLAVTAGGTYGITMTAAIGNQIPACINNTIVDVISSSPFLMNKTDIYQLSNYTWGVDMRWYAHVNLTGKYLSIKKILVRDLC